MTDELLVDRAGTLWVSAMQANPLLATSTDPEVVRLASEVRESLMQQAKLVDAPYGTAVLWGVLTHWIDKDIFAGKPESMVDLNRYVRQHNESLK